MMFREDDTGRDRGAALIAALAMMVIFVSLGSAYIGYMMTSHEDSRYSLQNIRANHLSRGGIYAGIGELQAALGNGTASIGQDVDIELPVYRIVEGERETYEQQVSVSISDEAAKVNLNSAPKRVLVALGIPANVVDALRRNGPAGARRLTSVDELRTGDYMNGQSYNALDKNLFTVYSGSADGGVGSINLNSASPTVLAGIFAIDGEEAVLLAQKRPFTSWDDVRAKVGREPSTFNVYDGVSGGREMPRSLSLTSRTYRLLSQARMVTRDTSRNGLHSAVEAVVIFSEDGSFSIRYWNETPSDETYAEVAEDAQPSANAQGDSATAEVANTAAEVE